MHLAYWEEQTGSEHYDLLTSAPGTYYDDNGVIILNQNQP